MSTASKVGDGGMSEGEISMEGMCVCRAGREGGCVKWLLSPSGQCPGGLSDRRRAACVPASLAMERMIANRPRRSLEGYDHVVAMTGPSMRRYGQRLTTKCRRCRVDGLLLGSAWSTFPPLCSDQSSAGTVRETVYRRRPGLPGRRTHHLEQPAGQRGVCPVSVNLPSASKTFLFQALFPDIITDPR